jgi:hypothetical protein
MPRDFLEDDSSMPVTENMPGRDFLEEAPPESTGVSLAKAIPRVAEDIYRGGMGFAKNLPGYAQSASSEVPGFVNTLLTHPGHLAGQGLAGLSELGQNVFNLPHDITNYAANRLNLFPKDINQKIQMGRMPDSSNEINKTFGQPEYPGEALTRGVARNALSLVPAGKAITSLNPLNMTAKSIAKDVVNTEKQQVKTHNKLYNDIWDQAEKSGFNNVPYDESLLKPYSKLIDKFYPERSTKMLKEFMTNPTLENAQRAQSDLGQLRRSLEEKSRTTPLLETEKDLYNALDASEKHIEGNMFKNKAGQVNDALKDQYKKVTNSYRENVVPYKYNPAIQAYKNKEMLPKELVNSLSRGEFAAKKGSEHPAIGLRNKLAPIATGAGLLGGGTWLYNQMFGNQPPEK